MHPAENGDAATKAEGGRIVMLTQQADEVKIPPHDLDAEEAVLGSLLIDPEAISLIVRWLLPQDFYREKNRWTYDSCLELQRQGQLLNQITVASELARRRQLEAAGGAAYISHLVSSTPTSVHIEYYAQIVQRLSFMRNLISAANQISAIAYESPPTIGEAINRAESVLAKLRNGVERKRGGFTI